jgi:feruloyl esterase
VLRRTGDGGSRRLKWEIKKEEYIVRRIFLVTAMLSILTLLHSPLHAKPVCEVESLPQLPDVTIMSVTQETQYAPHCKVAGVVGPEIRFELLLPEKWNGKFVMGGGGGFVGSVVNVALSYGAVQSGYATVGTDTGHQGHPLSASWALNNLERVVNFGHQAVHRTAVTAKALTQAYYQEDIARNYFIGCSRGGGQAMMEAQRYPEDFGGIVAGAPAYNWTEGLGAGTTQINQVMYPNPNNLQQAVVGPREQALIASGYLAQCDALDGIKDGILNDPRQCDFDVASLACGKGESEACLTDEQLSAVKTIYDGPRDKEGNLFYGFPFGGELSPSGWMRWLTGGLKYAKDLSDFQDGVESTGGHAIPVVPSAHYGFAEGVMKYLIYHDPDWNYANYNFDTFREDAKLAAATLNATNPDLSVFRKRGGKLLMFTGWSDMAISALGTIAYYEKVLADDATAAEDVRLILMPGVDHCFGGAGPSWVNFLSELDQWVATGNAPTQMTAYWLNEKNQPSGSRRLCAYPNIAQYEGKGNTRDVSSFSCVKQD